MIPPEIPAPAADAPPVWLLLGHKAGDNNQVIALAESLGLPYIDKCMIYRRTELITNLLLGPNLWGIRADCRAQLRPPWPRLVITAGRRNEPVARWIRRRADHLVRLVHIGRPWSRPARFDLVITTPQYRLAGFPNVLCFDLPLHRIRADRLERAAADWSPRLAHLPRPRIAVLVGGESGGFHLDRAKARRLGRQADALASSLGGSLVVTTSARTPDFVSSELAEVIRSPNFLYEWRPQAADNPYLAFLATADRFVVTGESMSMLTEACATRRPVYIFDMGDGATDSGGLRSTGWATRASNALRYKALTHRLAQRFAPVRMRRDISRLHDVLIDSGRAVWLGLPFPDREPPPLPEVSAAAQRVLALLEAPGSDKG
jgi:mitochondrial fission protein ELM1